jgi:hypothetical protein
LPAFNPQRSFNYLVKPQKFDKVCRPKVKAKLGKKFAALESLLTLFV